MITQSILDFFAWLLAQWVHGIADILEGFDISQYADVLETAGVGGRRVVSAILGIEGLAVFTSVGVVCLAAVGLAFGIGVTLRMARG